jgi:ribonuclease D
MQEAQPPIGISREQLADLPIRRYEGHVLIVETPADRERAMADILDETVVGFDTETRPAFQKGQTYLPCLAQVATARSVYLFRLARADFSAELVAVLEAPGVVKSGVAIGEDLRQLKALFAFEARRVVDPGLIARRNGLPQTGLRNLAALFLGIRIPKGNRTSNWAAHQLKAAQVTYAATDAWACRELFLRFEALGFLAETPPT